MLQTNNRPDNLYAEYEAKLIIQANLAYDQLLLQALKGYGLL